MSKIEVDAIVPQSGTTLTVGESGDTITIPSGATFDASNATTTLPSTVVTTTGSQTLTNKTIDVSQLSGTVATSNLGTGTADATTFLRGDQTYASATPAADSITTTQLAYNPNSFRNIIINGDMSIAQRATSVSGITGNGYFTLDRFNTPLSSLGTWTQSQSTDVPSGQGFARSFKIECTTANASPSSGAYFLFRQSFEGQNLQYLKKGTANAESLTASFWVKSNKTGTYILELEDADNIRSISKSYTINSADTWEKKTITFAGDTTGTLDNDNANSFHFTFWLGAGTDYTSGTLATSWGSVTSANRAVGNVNLADSTSNYLNITGLQLEAGTTASDFEFLPYDVNLRRCQRYFQKISSNYHVASGWGNGGSDLQMVIDIPVRMRASPTFSNFTAMSAMPFNKTNSSPAVNSGPTQLENGKIFFQTNGWGGSLTNQEIYLPAFVTNDCFMSAEL
jgi:hypothetical protein